MSPLKLAFFDSITTCAKRRRTFDSLGRIGQRVENGQLESEWVERARRVSEASSGLHRKANDLQLTISVLSQFHSLSLAHSTAAYSQP